MEKKKKGILSILVFIGITWAIGYLSNVLTGAQTEIYNEMIKPPFSPPSEVFGIVWGILYTLIGISAGLVYREKTEQSSEAIHWYFMQLAVNLIWPIIFFRFNMPWLALLTILLLLILAWKTYFEFKEINKVAGWLFIPYIAWLLFATYLNFGFAILN